MEGDAGASRLNPPPMSKMRRLRRREPKVREESDATADEINTEGTAEDSSESEVGTEQLSPEGTAEDSSESEVGTEQLSPEGTAEDSSESEVGTEQISSDSQDEAEPSETAVEPGPSRLRGRWLVGIAAALLLIAGAVGTGGYFALRYHQESQAMARNNAAALKAAMDCVAATQAPDSSAMVASEQKIIDCATGAFRSQALLYTSMIVQAYQASNVHVQVSDVRGAVERNDNDGNVYVLVAMRIKVSSDQTQNEVGYRMRATMAHAEGQYKISKLEQVTK
jgi:flagellar basal body-associated protein FliL